MRCWCALYFQLKSCEEKNRYYYLWPSCPGLGGRAFRWARSADLAPVCSARVFGKKSVRAIPRGAKKFSAGSPVFVCGSVFFPLCLSHTRRSTGVDVLASAFAASLTASAEYLIVTRASRERRHDTVNGTGPARAPGLKNLCLTCNTTGSALLTRCSPAVLSGLYGSRLSDS